MILGLITINYDKLGLKKSLQKIIEKNLADEEFISFDSQVHYQPPSTHQQQQQHQQIQQQLQQQFNQQPPTQSQQQQVVTKHVHAPVDKPNNGGTGGLPVGQNICSDCERLIV